MSAGPVQQLRALERHRDRLPAPWHRKVELWALLVGQHYDMRNLSARTQGVIVVLARAYCRGGHAQA